MGKQRGSNGSDVLSASEIGQFCYCSYAWRLRRMGYTPESPDLATGTKAHIELGNQLDDLGVRYRASRLMRAVGLAFLCLTLLLFFIGVIL